MRYDNTIDRYLPPLLREEIMENIKNELNFEGDCEWVPAGCCVPASWNRYSFTTDDFASRVLNCEACRLSMRSGVDPSWGFCIMRRSWVTCIMYYRSMKVGLQGTPYGTVSSTQSRSQQPVLWGHISSRLAIFGNYLFPRLTLKIAVGEEVHTVKFQNLQSAHSSSLKSL